MRLVSIQDHDAIRVITYANAPFGTMTAVGVAEMFDAVAAAGMALSIRVIVITGGLPGIFIRHYDVGELSEAADAIERGAPRAPPSPGPRPPGFHALTDAIAAVDKPVIAAINGLCMGGGFELSLACDLRIAGSSVTAIGLPETRIGIFPGGGGTQRLPRIVGEARALEMILRGLTVTGQRAHEIGIVHEVVADPLARSLEIGAELSGRSAEGLAFAKRLTRSALDRPLAEGLADERKSFSTVMRTASAREGLRAGRPPAEIQKL
ncbi:enoyl-CoA hydratase [Bradyrhizobium sp. USDA 4532]|uniref:enoyl-CoA hydratase/isomerase family protein n=1 Tax=unclassified Bradyrhizobium TaxID=2631580 RepID=UPI00209EA403|nr:MULTISPECIES: enoyl-CoA hydratase/isomerase family protein [unclassified Bradyrhizobium]MCP1833972.1 enoyl-CoA hydratase [Bradyrhizobium sp. USDA 4545]MCP1918718.1 enoyl-CoA hydratase [Bradyrhizobium sp. USDA 4532]